MCGMQDGVKLTGERGNMGGLNGQRFGDERTHKDFQTVGAKGNCEGILSNLETEEFCHLFETVFSRVGDMRVKGRIKRKIFLLRFCFIFVVFNFALWRNLRDFLENSQFGFF